MVAQNAGKKTIFGAHGSSLNDIWECFKSEELE